MTAAWRIYREDPIESLRHLTPSSMLFGSSITLRELLVWASQYGSNSFAVAGPSSEARSVLLREHAVAVTRAAVEECAGLGWPINGNAAPPTVPVATIQRLWSEWFGSVLPDMDNTSVECVVPIEAYIILASSRYVWARWRLGAR